MKYIILLSIIIILNYGCSAYGQIEYGHSYDSVKYERIKIGGKSYPMQINYSKGQVVDSMIWTDDIDRKRDTVSCLMLLCDTFYGKKPSGMAVYNNGKWTEDSMVVKPNSWVWYDWGYSVRELHNIYEVDGNPNAFNGFYNSDYNYNRHAYYLDKNKQKLSPNIVVWMSK